MKIVRWEIWLANLDPVVGSEQGRTRPVLVLSSTALNDILPVVNIVQLTSANKIVEFIQMKFCFRLAPAV